MSDSLDPEKSQNPYGQPVPSGQQQPATATALRAAATVSSPTAPYPRRGGDKRPGTVTAAAWIAIVFSV